MKSWSRDPAAPGRVGHIGVNYHSTCARTADGNATQRQSPGGGGDSSDLHSDDHRAPRRSIEDGNTPERAGSSPIDTHKQSFRYLLPILSRTYNSSSVKSRLSGEVEDGVSFDGRRSRDYRLIGPSGFQVQE
jgi:hypothetical protein